MTHILLLYGSTGGNTEITMEKIAEVLRKKDHELAFLRAECAEATDLKPYDVVILGSPTYGHGVLQEHMDKFMRGLPDGALKGKPCAVVGLGDAKYDPYYLIEAATILEEMIKKLGGKLIVESLKINKSPLPQLEGPITAWAEELAGTLHSIDSLL